MKAVRVLLFSAAAFLVLSGVIVAVAFTSGFQTWVARKVLASQPGLAAGVDRVNAGLGHIQVEQFHLTQSGTTVTVPSLVVELPVLSALRRKVQVTRLVARGWTIDLTRPAAASAASPGSRRIPVPPEAGPAGSAPAPVAAAVFQGIFNRR